MLQKNMENKLKYLEFIQNSINRMSSNSFALKGWSVTLIAGIFALATKDANQVYFLIAYVPIVTFWGLDSYYLKEERVFRYLYDQARVKDVNNIDFSMNIRNVINSGDKENVSWISCIFSVSEICFYLPLILISTIIVIVANS